MAEPAPAAPAGVPLSAPSTRDAEAVAAVPPDDMAPAELHNEAEFTEDRSGPSEPEAEAAVETADEHDLVDEARDGSAEEATEASYAGLQEPEPEQPPKLDWYILKVQSNREDSIRDGLQRRVAIAGLDKYFGEIIVPTEMVSEFKGGKKRVVKRKLYPGYLVVHMEINEDTWFLVRETPGIGDFTGSAGKPTPMLPHEVQKIVAKQEDKADETPKLKINFSKGDRVKINEGTFENFEGEVDTIDEASGRVTVMINIFGRSTPVELEYWQVESI